MCHCHKLHTGVTSLCDCNAIILFKNIARACIRSLMHNGTCYFNAVILEKESLEDGICICIYFLYLKIDPQLAIMLVYTRSTLWYIKL